MLAHGGLNNNNNSTDRFYSSQSRLLGNLFLHSRGHWFKDIKTLNVHRSELAPRLRARSYKAYEDISISVTVNLVRAVSNIVSSSTPSHQDLYLS